MANMSRISTIFFVVLLHLSEVESFIIQKNLDLKNHNFAFLTSFCGGPTGAVLKYNIVYPKVDLSPNLLSYYKNQWWQIWPYPLKSCREKQSGLHAEWGQVVNLTIEHPTAGCREELKPGNDSTWNNHSTIIRCSGEQLYQVDSYNPSTPKCWFIAANNCKSTGLRIEYTFNITGAYHNSSPRNHQRTLGLSVAYFSSIVFWIFLQISCL